jgi:hypothetical protein
MTWWEEMMPSRKMQAGDVGYIRMKVIEAASDAFRVLIDDGAAMSITAWVPVSECAKFENIGNLRPPRHANPRYMDR